MMNVDVSIIRSSFWLFFVFMHSNVHRIYIIPIKITVYVSYSSCSMKYFKYFTLFLPLPHAYTPTHSRSCPSQYLIWWTTFIKNYPPWDISQRRYAIKLSITRSNLAVKDQHIACNEVEKKRKIERERKVLPCRGFHRVTPFPRTKFLFFYLFNRQRS